MNLILATDSYKLTHHNMYVDGTERVYSYYESRPGAEYPETVFFGLQPLLKALNGVAVTPQDVTEAAHLSLNHFGSADMFNHEGWNYIAKDLGGFLPIRIKAVPEGTVVPTGNVLMTVENIDTNVPWLTNALESYLTHVWYPSTVATRSRATKMMMYEFLLNQGASLDGLDFMLHDFGYRGATTHEAAEIGGAAHLVNFKGSDTLPAIGFAQRHYGGKLNDLAFSVPATEHSVMTQLGPEGEELVLEKILDDHPTGIVSVVADSYDIYRFVDYFVGTKYKQRILDREGVFVVRPDSTTPRHNTPEDLTLWIVNKLAESFGWHGQTDLGYRILHPKVRVLWGDGIDDIGIRKILELLKHYHISAENMVFGMGGGLLQKLNRDTQRFAFKASDIQRDGVHYDVYKEPKDISKASKRGRLALVPHNLLGFTTVSNSQTVGDDQLVTVFEDGSITKTWTWDEVRERASVGFKTSA